MNPEITHLMQRLSAIEVLLQNLYVKSYANCAKEAERSLERAKKANYLLANNGGKQLHSQECAIKEIIVDFFSNNLSIIHMMEVLEENRIEEKYANDIWYHHVIKLYSDAPITIDSVEHVENASDSVSRIRVLTDQKATALPSSFIVKQPSENEARKGIAAQYGLFSREIFFYQHIAPISHIPHPKPLVLSQSDSVIILEDMGRYITGDQEFGYTVEEAKSVLTTLCEFHKHWMQNPLLEKIPIPRINNPDMIEALPITIAGSWKAARPVLSEGVANNAEAAVEALIENVATYSQNLAQGSQTLLHGDLRMENLLFEEYDLKSVIDWQLLTIGSPIMDLAYFLTQSGDRETREELESFAFHLYANVLKEHGYKRSHIIKQYHEATLLNLMFPIMCVAWDVSNNMEPRELAIQAFHRGLEAFTSASSI